MLTNIWIHRYNELVKGVVLLTCQLTYYRQCYFSTHCHARLWGQSLTSGSGCNLFSGWAWMARHFSRGHIHVKPICGVYGGTCSHANLLARSKFKVKLVQHNSDCYHCLHEGKLIPYTFPWTSAEGNESATWHTCITLDLHTVPRAQGHVPLLITLFMRECMQPRISSPHKCLRVARDIPRIIQHGISLLFRPPEKQKQ